MKALKLIFQLLVFSLWIIAIVVLTEDMRDKLTIMYAPLFATLFTVAGILLSNIFAKSMEHKNKIKETLQPARKKLYDKIIKITLNINNKKISKDNGDLLQSQKMLNKFSDLNSDIYFYASESVLRHYFDLRKILSTPPLNQKRFNKVFGKLLREMRRDISSDVISPLLEKRTDNEELITLLVKMKQNDIKYT